MRKIVDVGSLFVYCGLIYLLSSRSHLPLPHNLWHYDKLIHATAYFLMSLLAWRCFRHWIVQPRGLFWLGLLFCSVYGLTDEWHQSFVKGRSSDMQDWLADTLGAALAIVLIYALKIKQHFKLGNSQ